MTLRAVCGTCNRTIEREVMEGRPYPTVLLCPCGNRLSLRADALPRRRYTIPCSDEEREHAESGRKPVRAVPRTYKYRIRE